MSRLRSYKLPRPRSAQGAEVGEGGQVSWREDWAAESPWDHWANYEDPVGVPHSSVGPWLGSDLPWFFGNMQHRLP